MSHAPKEPTTPEFLKHFAGVDDPRQEAKVTYPLDEVFLLVLCAVISGAHGWKVNVAYLLSSIGYRQVIGSTPQ